MIYRVKHDLQQLALAEKLEISVNFLSQIENNKKMLSVTKLGEIAEKLGYSKELFIIASSEVPPEFTDKQVKDFLKMQDSLLQGLLLSR